MVKETADQVEQLERDKPRICKLCLRDDEKAKEGPGKERDRLTFPTMATYQPHLDTAHPVA